MNRRNIGLLLPQQHQSKLTNANSHVWESFGMSLQLLRASPRFCGAVGREVASWARFQQLVKALRLQTREDIIPSPGFGTRNYGSPEQVTQLARKPASRALQPSYHRCRHQHLLDIPLTRQSPSFGARNTEEVVEVESR